MRGGTLSTTWVYLTIPVFPGAAVLLGYSIRSLIRLVRASVVASVPAAPTVRLSLPASGSYQLGVEGKRFSRDFGGWDFELRSPNGKAIPLSNVLMRTTVSSTSRARITLRSFQVAEAGEYTVTVRGMQPGQDSGNRIIVSRPIGGGMVVRILAIVATAALTIGALVGTALILVLHQRQQG